MLVPGSTNEQKDGVAGSSPISIHTDGKHSTEQKPQESSVTDKAQAVTDSGQHFRHICRLTAKPTVLRIISNQTAV